MIQSKQTVLITGGGSGIGLALAEKFLQHGHTVIITGRNLTKLESVKAMHPEVHIVQSDVTVDADVRGLVDEIGQKFGGLDVLINNAGTMGLIDTGNQDNDLQQQFKEIEINYHAPIRMLHHFLPMLKKSTGGTLVNVSSGLAYVTFSQAAVYSGTKAALHLWTQGIRPQLKPHGIRVVELLPPIVDTKLADDADLKNNNLKPMSTEKLATVFWKDFNRGKDEIIPGISKFLKFMSRVAPKVIFNQLNKFPIPQTK